jgi:hypothetical protein
MRRLLLVIALCTFAVLAAIGLHHQTRKNSFTASAQTSCCTPPIDGFYDPWSGGNDVTVTISSAFTETERQAIIDAFQDLNVAGFINCSNVTFGGFLTGDSPVQVADNHFVGYDPAGTVAGFTVMNGAVGGRYAVTPVRSDSTRPYSRCTSSVYQRCNAA